MADMSPLSLPEYEIKREDDKVRKVFQDPTGAHVLVAMKSKECYYIGQASKRSQPRPLPRIKGQVIESVAWNKLEMKEQGTGAILLGTAQGTLEWNQHIVRLQLFLRILVRDRYFV